MTTSAATPMATKAKVYKGIACLEMMSPDGGKWWYAGGSLAYAPVLISEIKRLQYGVLRVGKREVLALPLRIDGREHLVALNLPRTDIVGLKARGLWPDVLTAPHQTTAYTPWPEYAQNNPRVLSIG